MMLVESDRVAVEGSSVDRTRVNECSGVIIVCPKDQQLGQAGLLVAGVVDLELEMSIRGWIWKLTFSYAGATRIMMHEIRE